MSNPKGSGAEATLLRTPDAADPEIHMLGLTKQAMALADATLLVQSHELPVHSFVLAANSPVLADLFETAFTADNSSSSYSRAARPNSRANQTRIHLEGDSVIDLCTVLRYCYSGCNMSSPDKPKLHTCKDAAGLVRVAHKYNMQGLHCEAEKFLIANASKVGGKDMFEDPSSLVEWVVLAESSKLDRFLAHAELYMIKHTEAAFWQTPMHSNSISIGGFLRVLRGALHSRQNVDKLLEDELGKAVAASCGDYGYGQCQCRESVRNMLSNLHSNEVTIDLLMQWHKQSA